MEHKHPRLRYSPARLMVADSSFLMNLVESERWHDFAMPPAEAPPPVPSPGKIVDALVLDRPRTLVITRSSLQEMLPIVGGSLDLYRDEEGKPSLPEGIGQEQFYIPKKSMATSDAIYHLLQRYQQMGKLRIYGSVEEMAEAGELEQAKGGIVIVNDMGNERNTEYTRDGRRFMRQRPGEPNHGVETSADDPAAYVFTNHKDVDKNGLSRTDRRYLRTLERILRANDELGLKSDVLAVVDDSALRNVIINSDWASGVTCRRTNHLVHALSRIPASGIAPEEAQLFQAAEDSKAWHDGCAPLWDTRVRKRDIRRVEDWLGCAPPCSQEANGWASRITADGWVKSPTCGAQAK